MVANGFFPSNLPCQNVCCDKQSRTNTIDCGWDIIKHMDQNFMGLKSEFFGW